jgi:hypothetical protein
MINGFPVPFDLPGFTPLASFPLVLQKQQAMPVAKLSEIKGAAQEIGRKGGFGRSASY